MKLGMPTLIETATLEECAMLCRDLGLSFIELNMTLPNYQINNINIKHLKEIAKKYNIFYTIHIDENLSPCDFNQLVANAYIQTTLQTIEFAKGLPAHIINMHLNNGVHVTLPDKKVYLFDKYEPAFLQGIVSFRDKCTAAIGNADIMISIENTSGFDRAPFIKKAISLLLDSPKFMLTLDTGHNATSGFADEAYILGRVNSSHISTYMMQMTTLIICR